VREGGRKSITNHEKEVTGHLKSTEKQKGNREKKEIVYSSNPTTWGYGVESSIHNHKVAK
jgi:hypothetical protein